MHSNTQTLLASLTIALIYCPCLADSPTNLWKLQNPNGAPDDRFGRAVAMSGNIAVVGAFLDDDTGDNAGTVFLFDTSTGALLMELHPDDALSGDGFGISVAIDDQIVVVGAWQFNKIGSRTGAAYAFDVATGNQISKFMPTDVAAGDLFGVSVGVSGSIAIVGSYHDQDNGTDSGSAYLFDTTTGTQLHKLVPDDGAAGDEFGVAVSICGPTAIVGSWLHDSTANDAGAAYLFDVATGNQSMKVLPDDGAANDFFGFAVAIDKSNAIIGAYGDNDNGGNAGSAYQFNSATGIQIRKLLHNDGTTGDRFGSAVSISGPTAVVGAISGMGINSDTGSATLFDLASGGQLATIFAPDGESFDDFGWSVSADGDVAVIGARSDDDDGGNAGSAYVFDISRCTGDLNCDGSIDSSDLGGLIGAFGELPGIFGFGDLNGDGIVDSSDLALLIGVFGTVCP